MKWPQKSEFATRMVDSFDPYKLTHLVRTEKIVPFKWTLRAAVVEAQLDIHINQISSIILTKTISNILIKLKTLENRTTFH